MPVMFHLTRQTSAAAASSSPSALATSTWLGCSFCGRLLSSSSQIFTLAPWAVAILCEERPIFGAQSTHRTGPSCASSIVGRHARSSLLYSQICRGRGVSTEGARQAGVVAHLDHGLLGLASTNHELWRVKQARIPREAGHSRGVDRLLLLWPTQLAGSARKRSWRAAGRTPASCQLSRSITSTASYMRTQPSSLDEGRV